MLTTEQIVLIGLFFIIAVLLWVLEREHITLAKLVPSEVLRDMIEQAVNIALDAADRAAAATPTTADDDLVKLIREEVAKALEDTSPPDTPPAVG